MGVVSPLSKERAAKDTHGIYDALTGKFGRMPNIFGVMAHSPTALSTFMPFFQAVMGSSLAARDKELAYLSTSMFNGCEY